MDVAFEMIKKSFYYCWKIWSFKFELAGHEFTLGNVAAVSVYIFVLGVLLDALLAGGWGGSD